MLESVIGLENRLPRGPLAQHYYASAGIAVIGTATDDEDPKRQELVGAVLRVMHRRVKAYGRSFSGPVWTGVGRLFDQLRKACPSAESHPEWEPAISATQAQLSATLDAVSDGERPYLGGIEAFSLASEIGTRESLPQFIGLIRQRTSWRDAFPEGPGGDFHHNAAWTRLANGILRLGSESEHAFLAELITTCDPDSDYRLVQFMIDLSIRLERGNSLSEQWNAHLREFRSRANQAVKGKGARK